MKEIFKKYIKTKEHKHAKFSPSSLERDLGCPGNKRIAATCPPQPTNVHSVRGTNTHTLIEFLIKEKDSLNLLKHPSAKEFKEYLGYDEGMLESAMVAVRFIKERYKKLYKDTGTKPTLRIEQKVSVSELVGDDCEGTSDTILYVPQNILEVMDYKNGRGVVEAENNVQMMTYGLGALEKFGYDFSEIWITVIQPNASHMQGPIRTWKTSVEKIKAFGKILKKGIQATYDENAPLVADTKYCYFCPGKIKCPEQQKKALVKINERFKKPDQFVKFSDPRDLDPLQIAQLLNARDHIEIFSRGLEKYAENYIKRGGKIPGWGLIPKQHRRIWVDPVRAEMRALREFGSQIYSSELLSPSQMEKIAGVKWVAAYSAKVSSGVKLGKLQPERNHNYGNEEKSNEKENWKKGQKT